MLQKWQMELESFKGIKSAFIMEGNINDLHPVFVREGEGFNLTGFDSINRLLAGVFGSGDTEGFYNFLFCDPLAGFSDPLSQNQCEGMVKLFEEKLLEKQTLLQRLNGSVKRENHSGAKMVANSEIIRVSMTTQTEKDKEKRKSIVNVVSSASRFLSSPDNLSVDETTFFLNLKYAAENAIRGNKFMNTLILVVDKLNDIPAWFYLNNPHVRVITIPGPDRNTRLSYIERFTAFSENASAKNKFVDLTSGMKLHEVQELVRLRDKSGIPPENIADVVAIYKYGFKENKWAQIKEKFSGDGNVMHLKIKERVQGQDQAIEKIVRVIKRSIVGLSGLQHSSDTKPRGILFLAGPTGTGKTETVKAVTEMLFGDEKNLIRFDMSEYSSENADQKLFGAPPGYVGYDNGGQLTNAVKSNPFSVLLFDEIEKAHSSIMDKFLQILEDGRMTDGQGNTVYFTETLIFFTSNVGISREITDHNGKIIDREDIVSPGEPYGEIHAKVCDAMRRYFKPEVINRIGENIVVFDYIAPEASMEILGAKIARINQSVMRSGKISIDPGDPNDPALKLLHSLCLSEGARRNGGRGIGNVIEEHYLNPLAEFIFDNACGENDEIMVSVAAGSLAFGLPGKVLK